MKKILVAAAAALAASGLAATASAAVVHFQFEGNGGPGVYDSPTGPFAEDCGTIGEDYCSILDNGVWQGLDYGKDGVNFTATAYTGSAPDGLTSTRLIQDIRPDNSGLGAFSEANPIDDQTQTNSGESIGFVFSQIVSLSNIEFRAGDDALCSTTSGVEGPCGEFDLYIDGALATTLAAVDLLAMSFVGTSFLFVPITADAGFAIAAFDVEAVPIPGALPLLISGLAGLGFASRRRKKA